MNKLLKPKMGMALIIKRKDSEESYKEEGDCGCDMAKDGIDTDILKDKDMTKVQETLKFLEHPIEVTGKFDEATKEHMKMCAENHNLTLLEWITLVDYTLIENMK